jgi:hypothetical protein
VSGRTSTNTGEAPTSGMASAVAANVNEGQKTASPGPIPHAISGSTSASVPEPQDRANGAWPKAASSASNCAISGPMM